MRKPEREDRQKKIIRRETIDEMQCKEKGRDRGNPRQRKTGRNRKRKGGWRGADRETDRR